MTSPIHTYLSYSLAAAHRVVHRSLAARLKEYDVQVEMWRVLETLSDEKKLSMGELADIVLMNPPTLTKMVDTMVMRGLVHRQPSENDQRQIHLLLTDLGKKRMQQIRAHVQDHDREIMKQIGPKAAKKLQTLLGELR